ncbi:MAG: sigma factor-like helix-turn-helix DNA-binding protein [Candidatus Zixiibacteriota bacterium]
MIIKEVKASDSGDCIAPHIRVLFQISMRLTRNGRDAIRLARDTVQVAREAWDESLPPEFCDVRLYDILTRLYFGGFESLPRSLTPIPGDDCDDCLKRSSRLSSSSITDVHPSLLPSGEADGYLYFLEAIDRLPSTFRSIVFLSFVEGFSTLEIAAMAGIPPDSIESLLDRGSELLDRELCALVLNNRKQDLRQNQSA